MCHNNTHRVYERAPHTVLICWFSISSKGDCSCVPRCRSTARSGSPSNSTTPTKTPRRSLSTSTTTSTTSSRPTASRSPMRVSVLSPPPSHSLTSPSTRPHSECPRRTGMSGIIHVQTRTCVAAASQSVVVGGGGSSSSHFTEVQKSLGGNYRSVWESRCLCSALIYPLRSCPLVLSQLAYTSSFFFF